MQIKFLNAKNFKIFSLVAAIVLMVFQLVKSVGAITGAFGTISSLWFAIDYMGIGRAIGPILQTLVGILTAVIALAAAAALGFAVITGKKDKLPTIGAMGLALAEVVNLVSVVLFGLISAITGGNVIVALIGWLISVVAQLVIAAAYVLFFAIVSKGCAPDSKIAAILDKLPEKLHDNILFVPGIALIISGIVAIVAAILSAFMTGLYAASIVGVIIGAVIGGIGTVILYLIKGIVLAIIGMWANDCIPAEEPAEIEAEKVAQAEVVEEEIAQEEVVEEAPVEEAPAEETPAEEAPVEEAPAEEAPEETEPESAE